MINTYRSAVEMEKIMDAISPEGRVNIIDGKPN